MCGVTPLSGEGERKKWEYKELNTHDVVDFELLGKMGWELVSVVYASWENERKGYQESETTYYFKRELIEE